MHVSILKGLTYSIVALRAHPCEQIFNTQMCNTFHIPMAVKAVARTPFIFNELYLGRGSWSRTLVSVDEASCVLNQACAPYNVSWIFDLLGRRQALVYFCLGWKGIYVRGSFSDNLAKLLHKTTVCLPWKSISCWDMWNEESRPRP